MSEKLTEQLLSFVFELLNSILVFQALVGFYRDAISDALEHLYQNYEQNYRKYHYKILVSVIAVIYGYLSKTAAADNSAHRRIA